ncbi:Protein kinase domain family protein [Leishmania donovani]|uniref:Protein kinase domain family protein n=1 Tax=Leishmania donovani TaxID=5661 RepID=A0A504X8X2_LEIDO|nr:Protein kinase domain family protein [Leishmania donovani]
MSDFSSSSSDSSSDDGIFTRRVEFQQRQRGASSSSSVPALGSSATRDVVAIISESAPPCTVDAVEAPATAGATTSRARSQPPDVAPVVLSERVTTQTSLQSASTGSEDKSSPGGSPVQRRRRRVAGTRPPAIKGALGSPTEPATEPKQQRGRRSSVSDPGSPLELPPPSRSSSRQRRTSVHSMSTADLAAATLVRASSNTLSTSTNKRTGGRGGGGVRRRYPRGAATTSLRALSPVSVSPTASAVNARLLSDEAYLDMFHIPALIAQLSLSLMAAKPIDPRAFTRDWLADRLVSEEDEDDDNADDGGGSTNSGSGAREQGSQVPPSDTAVLTRSTELPSSTSFVFQASGSTMGDFASDSGAARPCLTEVSYRQGRSGRHSRQRRRTNTSGEDEADDVAKTPLEADSDGDKTGTVIDRPASVGHASRKRRAFERRAQRKDRQSVVTPSESRQRGVCGISNGAESRRNEMSASSRNNTSDDADSRSPRCGSLLTTLAPPPAEACEHREPRAAECKASSPMQRSEEAERNATAAAPSTSADVDIPSSHRRMTMESESSTSTEGLSAPHGTTHGEHEVRQSSSSSRAAETAVNDVPALVTLSTAASSMIRPEASVAKRGAAKEEFSRSDNEAEEGGEAERHSNYYDPFAMFVPILAVDATTNEVIDYREAGVSPPSAPAFSPTSGGACALPSYPTVSASGVGGGHLAQTHTSTAVTQSSGFPPYATRPVSSTFNVLPTPMLADLVGGGGLTNTSFGRRGVPNTSFGRRPAPMAGAAGRYVDPAAGAMTGSSSPPAPFITPHAPMDLPALGVSDGVVDGESLENLQLLGFPKLNSNLAAVSVGSVTGVRTSGSAVVAGEAASVRERKAVQDDDVADSNTAAPSAFCQSAVLHGATDGARNTNLSLTKDTLGPVVALSTASSPVSSTMKLESARRLGKLLDQLPAAKYAAAIVFLEGLLSSSGGSSDAAATPESESISMMANIGDASNRNRGLLNLTSTAADTTLGSVGLSGDGSSPLVGSITPGRPWSGTFGPGRSPTGRARSFAHLVAGGSSQAPALAASGRNEDGAGALAMVSRAPEGGHSRSRSKGGSTSVEALVRDALSQSVLRSLPPTHEEVPGSVPSLPLRLEVSGRGAGEGTSMGMHRVPSPTRLENTHGERFASTATSTARANTSRGSSPVPVVPGGGSDDVTLQHPPSQSERSNLSFYKQPSSTDMSNLRRRSSSPSPGGYALTAAALQQQQQSQQQPVTRKATEDRLGSAVATMLPQSLSGPPPLSPAGNSSLATTGISVSEQKLMGVAVPTQPGASCVADHDEATTPEHSTARTATAADARGADSGNEDHQGAAFGGSDSCDLGSYAAQQRQNQALQHHHGIASSSDQSLAAHATDQSTVDRFATTGAAAEAAEPSATVAPKALEGTQRRCSNGNGGSLLLLEQRGARGDGDESTLPPECGTHEQFMPLDAAANPISLHTHSAESVSSLSSGTAPITNSGADGGGGRRAGNAPGYWPGTFGNSQVSGSAAAEAPQERPQSGRELCSSAAKSSSASAGGSSGVVGWGGTVSDSPSPPLHAHHPHSAGRELEFDDVNLGATLRMAVALAAAAGTQSARTVYGSHSSSKDSMNGPAIKSSTPNQSAGVAVVSGANVVTADPFASADANEGLSSLATADETYVNDLFVTHSSQSPPTLHGNNHKPLLRMVDGSGAGEDCVSLPSSQTVSLLNTCSSSVAEGGDVSAATASILPPAIPPVAVSADGTVLATPITAAMTPIILEPSTQSPPRSELPMVTSSVVVAMNSFFSREDHVAPEELEVVREVVAHYDAFASLDETQLETLVRTMGRMELQRGATVVREGDSTLGQLLLIVSGKLTISRKGLVTRTLARGQFYGEMEMSYHVERSRVTLTAATPTVVLYALKKVDYQKLVIHEKDARRYMFLQYVNECVLFKGLSPYIKMRLADSFRVCRLRKGTKLTEQGASVEWMYLLMSGNVRMTYQAPPSTGGETSDWPLPRRGAAPEEEARHTVTTSHSFSNFAGSTTLSEAHMSSAASAAAASTVAGTSTTRCGTAPSGITGSLSSSLTPLTVASQLPSSALLLSQAAMASLNAGAQQQDMLAERAASSAEACKESPLISMVSPSPGANAATSRMPQLLHLPNAKAAHANSRGRSGDHLAEQGADDGPPRPNSSRPRSRRLQSQQDRSVSGWQGLSQPSASAAESLDTDNTKPPSPLSTSASVRQSANTLLDTTPHSNAASTVTTSLTNTAAALAGAAGVHKTVVVVDRSKGQLVGETEFVFKCKGLFTAVATTPVQAARISRLHFEAIMTRAVVEEMKRSMLLNPDYYFFEFTVPEALKEDMRRMLFRLNVGPAARRRTRHAQQQQLLRHSVTGVEGTVSGSRSRGGTAGGNRDSEAGRRHCRQSMVLSRRTQREHNRASFMDNITGGPGGSSNGPNGTTGSSGSNSHSTSPPLVAVCVQDGGRERNDGSTSQAGSKRHHAGHRRFRTAPLEISPTMARLSTERATADSVDAAGMESSALHYLAAPTVCGGPFASPAVASTAVVSSTSAGEDSVSFTPAPAATMGSMGNVKGRGSSSDGDHNRYSRATARLTTAGRRTSFTKHSSTTTSIRRRVSTRGEIVFSGSRNLYRFTAEAMSMNESIVIAVVVDGTIIRWNSVAQSVTGYAPFEAIGKSVFDFIVSEDGRQHMRDTLAVAARFAGRWEQYNMRGLQEQRVFPFRQNAGLYQVGLALSVIPSNYAKTAEVLLLIGREGKYRAASTYAADVAKWLEGSLKPQLRQFQRRMVQIESHGWQLTAEDALQVRGNLDACMSMVEQFTKFSLLNMDVVSQSWRPVRVSALLRRFAVEAMAFARQQQHEYYCNIDLVEPKAEVFLDSPQVLAILRLLLGDALQCPNMGDDGNAIVVHAELRVTVVEPQDTNQVPLSIGSPVGRVSGGGSSAGGFAGLFAPPNIYPVIHTPVSAVQSSSEAAPLIPSGVSLPHRPLPRGHSPPLQAQKSYQHHGSDTVLPNHSHDSPLVALVNEKAPGSGGNAQGGADGSPNSAAVWPTPGSTTSSGAGMRGLPSAPISNALTSTLRRIRFELRDDGPTIPSLRGHEAVASERTHDHASPESASVDDSAALNSTSPKSASCTSERVAGDGAGDGGGLSAGLEASRSFTFAAASARRGAELEQVEKILANLGGVVYGFTRPEVPGNVVRVELPLLQQLCRVLWARQHAVVPVTSFRDLGRKLEMNTADILLIDPLHIDIASEDYESLLGDDPFDDIRVLSARLALVVMASDFSDWRVQKLLNRHAVVELPKVGSGALVHIAMQEAEQLVTEMRDEEERLDLIRRTFTNSSTERHKIGKRIGKGAFGDVFEVEDTLTGGKMAMKRMRLHDGLLADEVVQEILAMTTLTHENIIQYFYCEKESDTLLRLYMELAPGGTLRDKIRETPGVPLPFEEIVHHLSCICHGLAYVHEKSYVHGDLKTANLLLGTRNRTKIGDFGTAKHLAPHQLLYTMVGTPQYMAPEVLTADVEQRLGYDFKADIWSLGCIVLEMATGSPPFAHMECAQGMGIIKYLTELTDTPDLSPLFSGNPLVYEFVKSCLDVDPQNRPTAQELLHFDILEGAAAGQRLLPAVSIAHHLRRYTNTYAQAAFVRHASTERMLVEREVITLAFGNYSSLVAAQWANGTSRYDAHHNTLYSECRSADVLGGGSSGNRRVRVPRLLLLDAPYASAFDDIDVWARKYKDDAKSGEEGDAAYNPSAASPSPVHRGNAAEEEDHLLASVAKAVQPQRQARLKQKLFDERNTTIPWWQYITTGLGPNSVTSVKPLQHVDAAGDLPALHSFGYGLAYLRDGGRSSEVVDFNEALRHNLEAADQLQGVQCFTDGDGLFGGAAANVLEQLWEEAGPNTPVVQACSFARLPAPVADPAYRAEVAFRERRMDEVALNQLLATLHLSRHTSAVYIPVPLSDWDVLFKGAAAAASPTEVPPWLEDERATAQLLAAVMDTALYGLRDGSRASGVSSQGPQWYMDEWCRVVRPAPSLRVAAAMGALPQSVSASSELWEFLQANPLLPDAPQLDERMARANDSAEDDTSSGQAQLQAKFFSLTHSMSTYSTAHTAGQVLGHAVSLRGAGCLPATVYPAREAMLRYALPLRTSTYLPLLTEVSYPISDTFPTELLFADPAAMAKVPGGAPWSGGSAGITSLRCALQSVDVGAHVLSTYATAPMLRDINTKAQAALRNKMDRYCDAYVMEKDDWREALEEGLALFDDYNHAPLSNAEDGGGSDGDDY